MSTYRTWTAEEIAALPRDAVLLREDNGRPYKADTWGPGFLALCSPLALIWPQPEPEQYPELHSWAPIKKGSTIRFEHTVDIDCTIEITSGGRAWLIAPAPDREAEARAEKVRKVAEAMALVDGHGIVSEYIVLAEAAVAAMEADQ